VAQSFKKLGNGLATLPNLGFQILRQLPASAGALDHWLARFGALGSIRAPELDDGRHQAGFRRLGKSAQCKSDFHSHLNLQ
jgi:hypothetical protein